MAQSYLQYIRSRFSENSRNARDIMPSILVSGEDTQVRSVVANHLIELAFQRHKPLIVLDNAPQFGVVFNRLGRYRIRRLMEQDVSLGAADLLDVSTQERASRLRTCLADLGFDTQRAFQVQQFLQFVTETEKRLGNTAPLTFDVLEEYGGSILVTWKLDQLVETGKMSPQQENYLLGRYSEFSAAAADFEAYFPLLRDQFQGQVLSPDTAVYCPFGHYRKDKIVQQMMANLVDEYLRRHPAGAVVLVLDDGGGDRSSIVEVLRNMCQETESCLLSHDVFTMQERDMTTAMSRHPVQIYSRHQLMSSCEQVERLCGSIDVVYPTVSVTRDYRLRANSPWDVLLDRNKQEHRTLNAPVQRPRYRKEVIARLADGNAIVRFQGESVLFTIT